MAAGTEALAVMEALQDSSPSDGGKVAVSAVGHLPTRPRTVSNACGSESGPVFEYVLVC